MGQRRENAMLTPAHPDRDDPRYREKKEQQRRDRADKRQRPAAWGFPGPEGADGDGADSGSVSSE